MRRLLFFLLLSMCLNSISAQLRVNGTVKDWSGNFEIPGVTVLLKGTLEHTTTDSLGRYRFIMPESGGTLIFRFLGYTTQEILITKELFKTNNAWREVNILLKGAVHCYGPTNQLEVQVLSGVNHLHYGFQGDLQLAYFNHPFGRRPVDLQGRFAIWHQFFENNRQTTLRLGRFNNFFLAKRYFDTEIEISSREILSRNFNQNLQEIALINSANTKFGDFGLGVGLQTEKFESRQRESVALVAEWEHTFFRWFSPGVQLKKWQEATQLKWSVHYTLRYSGFRLGIYGNHFKDFNELSVGLAYGGGGGGGFNCRSSLSTSERLLLTFPN